MRTFNEHIQQTEKILESSSSAANDEAWKKWRSLVNMTLKELEAFQKTEEGKEALSSENAKESFHFLLKMIPTGSSYESAEKNWTPLMWKWCKKQNSYISRMRSMRKRMIGNPFTRDEKMTKWLKMLLIWGHDPRKPLRTI